MGAKLNDADEGKTFTLVGVACVGLSIFFDNYAPMIFLIIIWIDTFYPPDVRGD